jgi:fatty acid desaturase
MQAVSLVQNTDTLISTARLRELSRVHPFRSLVRAAVEWAMILGLIGIAQSAGSPWLYLPTILLIASRQHALLILMHEAAHYRLNPNRRWNDWVGEALAWPLLLSMRGYRRHHMRHHDKEHLNTMLDPDWSRKWGKPSWSFPKTPKALAWLLLRDALGLTLGELRDEIRDVNAFPTERAEDRRHLFFRLSVYGVGVAFLFSMGLGTAYLAYWLLPSLTLLRMISRIRAIADHFGTQNDHPLAKTRTVTGNVVDRILISPCNIGVHNEHHLFPSVPYYNLRALQRELSRHPEYQVHAPVSSSYWSALLECTQRRARV